MILAVVGSRGFPSERWEDFACMMIMHEVISPEWESFVTGDPRFSNSRGVDSLTVDLCRDCGKPCEVKTATARRWEGPGGFRERNEAIVDACDKLLCIRDPRSQSYGSGWTADHAESRGKLLMRIEMR